MGYGAFALQRDNLGDAEFGQFLEHPVEAFALGLAGGYGEAREPGWHFAQRTDPHIEGVFAGLDNVGSGDCTAAIEQVDRLAVQEALGAGVLCLGALDGPIAGLGRQMFTV